MNDIEHVYVVLKNADFTEGRGPMLYHKIFKTQNLAHEYIMGKSGIYGTQQATASGLSKNDSEIWYNGYILRKEPIIDKVISPKEVETMRDRIKDLEREILTLRKIVET